jgi:hypothetical protein
LLKAWHHISLEYLAPAVRLLLGNRACGRWPTCLLIAERFDTMNTSQYLLRTRLAGLLSCSFAVAAMICCAQAADGLVPLPIKLPSPGFKGTPAEIKTNLYTEPFPEKQPTLPMVPAGLQNLAPAAKVTCSDKNATSESLAKVVDSDKEASEQSIIYLRKGTQWVQLDFGSPQEIFAVALWHAHDAAKVYHDVVVQVADDPDFINARTLFNNDQDNTSGLGVGTDREYFETHYGKVINAKGVKARYLRTYSKGSTQSALNEYTELEVYGRPAK